MREGIHSSRDWAKLLIGFALLFAVLQGSAAALQSLRGESGLIVVAAVVAVALLLQRVLFAKGWREGLESLGLGATQTRGVTAALGVSALTLCAFPLFLIVQGGEGSLYPGALWLALGIFAQAGVAEEVVFRGYLYGHIRRGRTFWRAALLSAIPFAIAHLYLFTTMAWPIAFASLLLSVAISFPFAWLYELGGRTIWAPAIVHAVVQGAIKLYVIEDPVFPLVWIGASLVAPWLVFFVSSSAGSRS
jgi:membrane protease YdiL (CAAX protease family)